MSDSTPRLNSLASARHSVRTALDELQRVHAAIAEGMEQINQEARRIQGLERSDKYLRSALPAHKACVEALADLVPAIKKHINASGGADGYLLARLSDAESALAALEALEKGEGK
jgi:hypothetical protein